MSWYKKRVHIILGSSQSSENFIQPKTQFQACNYSVVHIIRSKLDKIDWVTEEHKISVF